MEKHVVTVTQDRAAKYFPSVTLLLSGRKGLLESIGSSIDDQLVVVIQTCQPRAN